MATKKRVSNVRKIQGVANTDALEGALASLRHLVAEGEGRYLTLMEALMGFYEHKEIWGVRYHTWDSLLREEGFCTPHTYEGFVQAYKAFGKEEVRRLGVRASVLLVRQSKSVQGQVLTLVNEWLQTHVVPPTYQRVSTYTRQIIGTVKKPRKAQSRDENTVQLKKQLQKLKREAGVQREYQENLERYSKRAYNACKKAGIKIGTPPQRPEVE